MKYFLHLGKSTQDALASYTRIKSIIDITTVTNGTCSISEIRRIEAKQLIFSYHKESVKLIEGFSYTFEKGNMYAIIGDNGCGKSTVVDLLLGLNQGSFAGDILYNDINIKEIDMNKARNELIAVSEQEPLLIGDTLRYNLFFEREQSISDLDLHKIIKAIGLQPYIDQLPKGLDTCISESISNISCGEKQKIAILRSLIKSANLLIFDEPTSALDKKSISGFLTHLQSIKNNKIIVIITHDALVKSACDYTVDLSKASLSENDIFSDCI